MNYMNVSSFSEAIITESRGGNLQMYAMELHDFLLHFVLVRQQLVCPQEIHVCYIIIVTNLRCYLKSKISDFYFFTILGKSEPHHY